MTDQVSQAAQPITAEEKITTNQYGLYHLRVVTNDDKLLATRSHDLFLSETTAATLDEVQVFIHFISTINTNINLYNNIDCIKSINKPLSIIHAAPLTETLFHLQTFSDTYSSILLNFLLFQKSYIFHHLPVWTDIYTEVML